MIPPLTRAVLASTQRPQRGFPLAAAATARLPLAGDFAPVLKSTRAPQPTPTPTLTPLARPAPRLRRDTGHAGAQLPSPSRQLAELQKAYDVLQTKHNTLEHTHEKTLRELEERVREAANWRQQLADLQQLVADVLAESPRTPDQWPTDSAAAAPIVPQDHGAQLASTVPIVPQDHGAHLAVNQVHVAHALTADEIDSVEDIVAARAAIGRVEIASEEQARVLAHFTRYVEAVVNEKSGLSSHNLTTIKDVLDAFCFRAVVTPATGNCQMYAAVQAATQYCLLELQRTAGAKSSESKAAWEAAMRLAQLERTTAALKRGIRGSARLWLDKATADSDTLLAFVMDIDRADTDVEDVQNVENVKDVEDLDAKETELTRIRRAIIQKYLDEFATSASDVATTISSDVWGSQLTLLEMSKVLDRPIYVFAETPSKKVTYQRYAPRDATGPGTMYMAVDETNFVSFEEVSRALLADLAASKTQVDVAPLALMLRGNHYSAVVVDSAKLDLKSMTPKKERAATKKHQPQAQERQDKERIRASNTTANTTRPPQQNSPTPLAVEVASRASAAPGQPVVRGASKESSKASARVTLATRTDILRKTKPPVTSSFKRLPPTPPPRQARGVVANTRRPLAPKPVGSVSKTPVRARPTAEAKAVVTADAAKSTREATVKNTLKAPVPRAHTKTTQAATAKKIVKSSAAKAAAPVKPLWK